MMAPRGKKMMGVRRGPPPEKGPMPQGVDTAQRGMGVPKMGVGTPAEMAPPRKMRMAAETMGTTAPTPMRGGGLAKKGHTEPSKTPVYKKGGMAAKKASKAMPMKKGGKAKAGLMIVIGVGKKKGK